MRNKLLLSTILLIVACGDNLVAPDSDLPPVIGPIDDFPVDPGSGCVAIDWNQSCPADAGDPPPVDAPSQVEVDAFCDDDPPPLDDEKKAACYHALLDGTPPNHECGYPPGLCKNGKKVMFCKNANGTDAWFELCNP